MKKAKEWFIKAVKLNPDLGDTWATYYKFTAAHGTEDELKVLVCRGLVQRWTAWGFYKSMCHD